MKKKLISLIILLFTIILLTPTDAVGQKNLHISGWVYGDGSENSDIKVLIMKDTTVKDTRKVLQSGTFFAAVPLDSGYFVKFVKPAHIPQIISIQEKVNYVSPKDTNYSLKDVRIKLFRPYDSIPTPEFDNAVGMISYLNDSDKFIIKINPIVEKTDTKLKNKREADELYLKKYQPIFDEKIWKAIKEANAGNFDKAEVLLSEAKQLFPNNGSVGLKKQEIDKMKRSVAERIRQDKINIYRTIITKADNEFKVQNYDQAKNLYVQAQSIRPEEQYPSYMLKRIDEFIGIKETKQMDVLKVAEYYERTIRQGDSLMNLKKYNQAKLLYQKAIRLNRSENYAKSKIILISTLIGDENKTLTDSLNSEKKYANMILLAENAYKAGNLTDAISLYRNSLKFKPDSKYPNEQIKKIEDLQAQKKSHLQTTNEIEQKYQQLIKDADFYLTYKKIADAEGLYNEALKVKPTDAYVTKKLNEINQLKKEKAEIEHTNNRKEEQYADLIKAADSFFTSENYKEASKFYTNASQIKAIEPYPKSQLLKINEILKEQEKNKNIEIAYKNAIELADKALERKDYYDAKNLYKDALYKKNGDQYANNKLAQLNDIISKLEKSNQENINKQIAFSNAIAKGELKIRNGNLAEAKIAFEQAKEMGINTNFCIERISNVQNLIDEENKNKEEAKKREEKYKLTIVSGDEAFNSKNYTKAKEAYLRAIELQFNDPYPRDRINEIENILNKNLETELNQKNRENAINEALSSGDSAYAQKKYFEASIFYKRASSLKKNDESIKNKLSKTISMLEEEKKIDFEARKKEKDFNNMIFQAENLILVQNYDEAIRLLEESQKFNPSSPLPKEKIIEAKNLIERKQKQKEDEIKDNLIMAEKALSENDFRVARYYFSQVLNLKQDSKEAIEKLKELDKLDGIKKKETKVKAFAEAIDEAKKAYNMKELNVAEYYYTRALEINPDDQSPTEMIEKIKADKAALQQKNIDDTYTDYIKSGNNAIESKDYGAAITYFTKAKNLKPLEPYPDQKIIEVKKLIAR